MSYKQTTCWHVDHFLGKDGDVEKIKEAALWIRRGEVVAFPTETVYGLGANALDEEAVKKIFIAKGRPSDNPLIVHIAKESALTDLVERVPEKAKRLIDAFWPGPLTIIFKKSTRVAPSVTAGLDTIAIRMPDHPVAQKIIEEARVPVAAPSANVSGKPSPTKATHVINDLNGKIAGIVDAGPTGVGLESTVIDCTKEPPVIYRPGGVTKEAIEAVIGKVDVARNAENDEETPLSPGMKYTHYAPDGALYLVSDPTKIEQLVRTAKKDGKKVGVLTTEEGKRLYDADVVVSCGTRTDLQTVATSLYDSLRTFDRYGVDVIYAETFPQEGVGAAIMNRLEKAALGKM